MKSLLFFTLASIFTLFATAAGASPTCVGLCDSSDAVPGSSPACFCDPVCELYGDCCADRVFVCGAAVENSCSDMCGSAQASLGDERCHCDALCTQYDDCCSDYTQICTDACSHDIDCALGSACEDIDDDGTLECVRDPQVLNLQVPDDPFGNFDRIAIIHPGIDTGKPSPVVFFFHGFRGSARGSRETLRLHELWPEAIVVYAQASTLHHPNSADREWTPRFPYKGDTDICGGPALPCQVQDVIYIEKILSELEKKYDIDEDRVFALGHSSGGFFTLSLTELLPDVFAGYGLNGAYARFEVKPATPGAPLTLDHGKTEVDMSQIKRALHPRPVLYMFGNNDDTFEPRPDYPGDAGSHGWQGYNNNDPSAMSLTRSTLEQLLIRNGISEPAGQYWHGLGQRSFHPDSAPAGAEPGADVVYYVPVGAHGWTDDRSARAITFFKSLTGGGGDTCPSVLVSPPGITGSARRGI